jgi:transcriptional regulator with XRE-family HTH domain
MEMTVAQCKMARAALDWTARDLARHARVGHNTVGRFEAGQGNPIPAIVAAMQRALEAGGVEFRPDGSVRLREPAEAAR